MTTTTAEKLYEAYASKRPLAKGELTFASKEAAYDVQDEVLALKEANGETHKGYKISLTSEETQRLFNSETPLFGQMTDVTLKQELSLSDFNEPLLEMELVFLVDEDVHGSDSDEEVMRKCRVAPGIEVPDGRYEDWFPKTTFHEVIADGAVNGALVTGDSAKYSYDELADVEGVLYFNDEELKRGTAKEVLGHPVNAVKWLAQALEERGEKLITGRFVSSGTFILPVPLEVGAYRVEYSGVGTVELTVNP